MLDENLDYYSQVFVKRGKVPPTMKEFIFAQVYLATNNQKTANDAAGYPSVEHLDKHTQMRYTRAVKMQPGIQNLLKFAVKEWYDEQQITVRSICNKALKAYENAETVRDQLNALKFIAKLGGYI